jgi:serine/threonine protein kinase
VGVIGRTLSHYRIVEPLGAGGMGEVYRARDEKLGRDVAVKVLPADSLSDEAARRRFQKEAEALVRLSHPHIATLFDVDSTDGTDFIVMEVVPGPTLKERLQEGPLEEKEVVRLGTQLVRGLMAAHEKGIVHRDLKPSNLSLTEDGLLKILDFGLVPLLQTGSGSAGETAPTETAAGRAAGTLPYMSPEQLRGRSVDARSDLYAVGAVLFELATGRRVFEQANEVDLADAILHEPPPSPRSHKSTLSPGLEAIVLKALDKDPELRYQTARELIVDLERLQQQADSPSTEDLLGTTHSRKPEKSRSRKRGAAIALALGALLAAGTWALWPPSPPQVTNVRPLTGGLDTSDNTTIAWDSWATDGVRLYFLSSKDAATELFQIPATGGEALGRPLPFRYRNVIRGYLAAESALLMAGSDASHASFTMRAPDETVPVWIVPVPAGAPSRVGDRVGWAAAASRDGQSLAMVDVEGRKILVVRRDGSIEHELGPLPTEPTDLALGPDGRRIRYTADGFDSREDWIWEISIDGGKPRPLWPGGAGRWSGDGRYFSFIGGTRSRAVATCMQCGRLDPSGFRAGSRFV